VITTEQRQELIRIMTAKSEQAEIAKTKTFYIWRDEFDDRMLMIEPEVWRDRMIALVDDDPDRFARILDSEWWAIELIQRVIDNDVGASGAQS
jgi:hypothetical protein